ncbi:MAG: FkbM family methyltransferase [Planctomycetota bacterium]
MPIRHLADALRQAFPDGYYAVDIGANVGDTAAAINAGGKTPVLCIEGDPSCFRFLEHNAKALGQHVVVEKCFVGDTDGQADEEQLDRCQGTTTAVRAIESAAGGLPVRRLESILRVHPQFEVPQLVKIDTDGYDFRIILSHLPFLLTRKPVLFFEYIVDARPSYEQSLECIDALIRLGYEQFFVFDNFGNFLLSTTTRDTLRDLNLYLLSNAMFGTAVNYLDICAIPDSHQIVARILREKLFALTFSRIEEEMPDRGQTA